MFKIVCWSSIAFKRLEDQDLSRLDRTLRQLAHCAELPDQVSIMYSWLI